MGEWAVGVERERCRERRERMKSISTGAINEDALYVTSIFGFFCFFSTSSFVGVR